MTFSEILIHLKEGGKAEREGWDRAGQYVQIYRLGVPINESTAENTGLSTDLVKEFRPYILHVDASGFGVPWTASQADILADDWKRI